MEWHFLLSTLHDMTFWLLIDWDFWKRAFIGVFLFIVMYMIRKLLLNLLTKKLFWYVNVLCVVWIWNEWEKSPTVIRFVEVKFTCQSKWRTCDKLFYFRFQIKFYVLQCENCEWIESPQYKWYIKQEYLIHSIALWI